MTGAITTLERIRKICLSLPDVNETKTFGHETWRVGKKTFAVFENYNGEWVVTFKATLLKQEHLIGQPGYYKAPYVGQHGWVCLKAGSINWRDIKGHIVESYRLNAPKSQLKKLPAGGD